MNLSFVNITYGDKPFYASSGFIPISAGSENPLITCDNTGDNISSKNKIYGELTANYWVWKNLKGLDAIGISHYRRYLMPYSWLKKTFYGITWKKFENISYDVSDFKKDLLKYDLVFCKKWHFEGLTVHEEYLNHHPFPEDLEITRIVLEALYPETLSIWDTYMNSSDSYCCCMFVAKWDRFDDLCSWMFPLLFEIEKCLDFTKYDNYQMRVIAYLYERLLNVYIAYNNLKVKEYPFYFIDNTCKKSIIRQEIGARIWDAWLLMKRTLKMY